MILLFQNTYTNAEKLLAAAQELAQTGECSPNEIYAVARQLEQHVGYAPSSPYILPVILRPVLLMLSCSSFKYLSWFFFFSFSRFVTRVAQRRHILDLAVLFYTHLAEVTTWLESLRRHLLEDLNFSNGTPSLEDTQVY